MALCAGRPFHRPGPGHGHHTQLQPVRPGPGRGCLFSGQAPVPASSWKLPLPPQGCCCHSSQRTFSVVPRQLGARFRNYTVVTTCNYSGLSLSVPLTRRTGIHKATRDSEQHCSGQPCKGNVGRLHSQVRKPRLRSALPAVVMSQCCGQDSGPWLRVVPGCPGARSSHLHSAPCPGLALGCAPA